MHNAKAGGEIGANGEFYKGGQFVADTEDWEKTHNYKPRKVCVEPYKWEIAHSGQNAIFHELYRGEAVQFSSRKSVDENGVVTYENTDFVLALPICAYDVDSALRGASNHGRLKLLPNYQDTVWYHRFRKFYGTLLGMWIRGERYVSDEFLANLAVASGMKLGDKRDNLATLDINDNDAVAEILAPSADVIDEEQFRRRTILQNASKYVGTVGEKMERDVTVKAMVPFESDYGGGTIYKFSDKDGNEYVWMTTSGFNRPVATGDSLRIKFTVKGHDTYADVPQTKITRVKAVA